MAVPQVILCSRAELFLRLHSSGMGSTFICLTVVRSTSILFALFVSIPIGSITVYFDVRTNMCPHIFDPWDTIFFFCGFPYIPLHHNRAALSYFLLLSHSLSHRFRSSSPNSAGGCFRPPITISSPLEEPSPRCQCLSGCAAEWGTRPSLSPRITPPFLGVGLSGRDPCR